MLREDREMPAERGLPETRKGLSRFRTIAVATTLAAAAVFPITLPGSAAAVDQPPARTLDEVVRGTLESEESLRIVAAEVRKAELRTRRYFLYLTPDLRLRGSYTRTGVEDSANDGGEGGGSPSGDRYGWGLALTQPLYTGGRASAAYRGQKASEASLRLQAELTGRALALAAAQAYYKVLEAVAAVDIGEQAVLLARRQFERAARRVELGEAVLNDQLRAEVSLRRLEADLAGSRSALAQAREVVRRLSGLELDANPVVPPPLPRITGSDESLVAEALAARREQEQARLAVSAAEEDVREKKGRFFPSLALSATYGETGEAVSDLTWAWSAGLVLEVPIYQSGSTTYELREARVGLEQQRLRAAGAARDIVLEVRNLVREIEAARSGIESFTLGVAAAAENLRLAERRYEVGLADSIEVADAQSADVAARVGLATAGYRLETLTLRLNAALGRELFAVQQPASPPR